MPVTGAETSPESSGADADVPADFSEEAGSGGSILEREPIEGNQSRRVVAGHFFIRAAAAPRDPETVQRSPA